MEKAKFLFKARERKFNEDFTFYFWEYRGYKYTTYINHNKGNEPLQWQHKSEQDRIDGIIEQKEKQAKEQEKQTDYSDVWNDLDLLWEE